MMQILFSTCMDDVNINLFVLNWRVQNDAIDLPIVNSLL